MSQNSGVQQTFLVLRIAIFPASQTFIHEYSLNLFDMNQKTNKFHSGSKLWDMRNQACHIPLESSQSQRFWYKYESHKNLFFFFFFTNWTNYQLYVVGLLFLTFMYFLIWLHWVLVERSSQVQYLCCSGLVALQHVESYFLDQELNLCPHIARHIFNHWITREVLSPFS